MEEVGHLLIEPGRELRPIRGFDIMALPDISQAMARWQSCTFKAGFFHRHHGNRVHTLIENITGLFYAPNSIVRSWSFGFVFANSTIWLDAGVA